MTNRSHLSQLLLDAGFLLRITRSQGIARRYFVVNGFDGALTMLGLLMGFVVSKPTDLAVVISVCMGAAIALGVSGVSSAYVSESAERKHSLAQLEDAMISDLSAGAHGKAVFWVPVLIALINGCAPLLISALIVVPLWLAYAGVLFPLSSLYLAMLVAMVLIFLLGVYLGRISGISWLRSGIQTLLSAALTVALIYLFAGY